MHIPVHQRPGTTQGTRATTTQGARGTTEGTAPTTCYTLPGARSYKFPETWGPWPDPPSWTVQGGRDAPSVTRGRAAGLVRAMGPHSAARHTVRIGRRTFPLFGTAWTPMQGSSEAVGGFWHPSQHPGSKSMGRLVRTARRTAHPWAATQVGTNP